jgi:hypothetical protein
MPGRMPFTFNTMVLLPLLRSLPTSGGVSVVVTLATMFGLDLRFLGLVRPETLADDLVAWMMSFSVAVPACWGIYMVTNAWNWVTSAVEHHRRTRR